MAQSEGKRKKKKVQGKKGADNRAAYKNARAGAPNGCIEQQTEESETGLRNLEWMKQREEAGLLPIWTMDIETDPFERDHLPEPFACELFDGYKSYQFWSRPFKGCMEQAREFLEGVPPEDRGIIYMHNGGRFDFFYMLDWFEGKTMIIGSRIVRAFMNLVSENTIRKRGTVRGARWEFRDSFAIMPFPLKAYQKKEIEMWKLKKEHREKHRAEISEYLHYDCYFLWELCMEFTREFGEFLTIASAAFNQLTQRHKWEAIPARQDADIRSKFYYGGRVQCFKKGVIEQPCKIYDVNSMYPAVMQNFLHPVSWCSIIDKEIRWSESATSKVPRTFFITAEGRNYGAFPIRLADGSIDFTKEEGTFHVSIHEWNVALELGLFKPTRILATYNFANYSRFYLFVDHFFRERAAAKKRKDAMRTLFYKYILNSAYGKFALNPENYFNWKITKTAEMPKGNGWVLDALVQGKYYVWKSPSAIFDTSLKNIATAASITGAARAILLRAIHGSRGVLYCDTDSLICAEFGGGELDDVKIGSWKTEAHGTRAAIAGKKLYAVFDGDRCIKQANKGVILTPEEILDICSGKGVTSHRDAPTFQRDGSAKFISRNVRMT